MMSGQDGELSEEKDACKAGGKENKKKEEIFESGRLIDRNWRYETIGHSY